jgi:hypothetical protein
MLDTKAADWILCLSIEKPGALAGLNPPHNEGEQTTAFWKGA